jgi:adenylate cyclase, class 2
MKKEFETQILDIDKASIIKQLRKLGAKEEPEKLQKRWVFNMMDEKGEEAEYIRVRQADDEKPIITYKKRVSKAIEGTSEIEIEVDDFDKTTAIFSKLKFVGKYYQENKRQIFLLNDIEFSIDTWPKIPVYLEIEAKSQQKVEEGLKLLDLVGKDVGHIGASGVFRHYGLDLHSYSEMKF